MSTQSNPNKSPGGTNFSALLIVVGVLVAAIGVILAVSVSVGPIADQAVADEQKSSEAEKQESADASDAEEEEKGEEEDLEPIPIKLPNPVFAGTPQDTPPGARMLPPTGLPREPYLAPKGLENVARDLEVDASDDLPLIGTLDLITDGDKEALDGRYVELAPGPQWVQLDLEDEYEIYAIVMWLNHMEARVYRGVIVQVSNDPEFEEGVTTLFNNDHENTIGLGAGEEYQYFESADGKLVEGDGIVARYVRVHTNGSTMDDQNHFTEVEVWAREPQD
ncbi:MAG: discoidin domain-containing protein [Phycisphaeraceae bacterium]